MSDELPTQYIGALRCVSVGWPGEHRFLYLPATARLDAAVDTPAVHLVRMDSAAQLSLQVSWEPEPGLVDGALQQLARMHPGEAVSLQPAELENVQCTLVLTDSTGTSRELGPLVAHDTPAHRLALVESISLEDADAVQAAMDGTKGRVHIRHEGDLCIDACAEVTLHGTLQMVYALLVPPPPPKNTFFFRKPEPERLTTPSPDQARKAVDEALAHGSLKLDIRRTSHVADDMVSKAGEQLMDTVVRLIQDNWHSARQAASARPEELMCQMQTPVREQRQWRFNATSDLALAFAAGGEIAPHSH